MNYREERKEVIALSKRTLSFFEALRTAYKAQLMAIHAVEQFYGENHEDTEKIIESIEKSFSVFQDNLWEITCECMKDNGLYSCKDDNILIKI